MIITTITLVVVVVIIKFTGLLPHTKYFLYSSSHNPYKSVVRWDDIIFPILQKMKVRLAKSNDLLQVVPLLGVEIIKWVN